MSVSYTYPGVYIQEIPSGVHTIAGVSTSTTAFVDCFARGPLNQATMITSYADFERIFGGLDSKSEASYAISQYYLNGGQLAWVVRVADDKAAAATVTLPPPATGTGKSGPDDGLVINAVNVGGWGNNLRVQVVAPPVIKGQISTPFTFNFLVQETTPNPRQPKKPLVVNNEVFYNLTLDGGANDAAKVVNAGSQLVVLEHQNVDTLTTSTDWVNLTGGKDSDAIGTNTTILLGTQAKKTGIYALETIAPALFNVLCLPAAAAGDDQGNTKTAVPDDFPSLKNVYVQAEEYCREKRAFLIIDIPRKVNSVEKMQSWAAAASSLGLSDHAAVYFPRLQVADPLMKGRLRSTGASGTMAGLYGRIDTNRGVWKAPAGTEAVLRGAFLDQDSDGKSLALTDLENGELNPLGINVLRNFLIFGTVAWGARTLDGADQKGSNFKYIPIRRFTLFIEESLYESTKWIVFEPNDEPLWSQIRLNIGAFMHDLFRQGAFQGTTPNEAYFVRCDKTTTTQNDINKGIVNIIVGFAPLKPAEFVVIQIQQIAGQIQV